MKGWDDQVEKYPICENCFTHLSGLTDLAWVAFFSMFPLWGIEKHHQHGQDKVKFVEKVESMCAQ